MKILFLVRHFGYVRNFEWAVRLLAERGHALHIGADVAEERGEIRLVEALARDYPAVTYGWNPGRRDDAWFEVARQLRLCIDYLRYLDPRYQETPRLRARAEERTPSGFLRLMRLPLAARPPGRRLVGACLDRLERAAPIHPKVVKFVQGHAPDLVLLTPLLELGTPQLDYLRTAKALGIRTILCVYSWDNLSSKSLIRDVPDLVTVWNETQKAEAVELHRLPPDRVAVTGAQPYDHWFDWPARPRGEFCRLVGLPPDRPFFLYLGSALFRGSASEVEFVGRWLRVIRSAPDPSVRAAGVLIRPHPQRMKLWRKADFSEFEHVVLWPPSGASPVDTASRADYFDSMYHSVAVVGLNTSALIEAGIVGRAVHTILLPEFADNQEGTLHFPYLLRVSGGLLRVARSLDEHRAQLADALAGVGPDPEANRAFVRAFVRPFGLDVAAAPRFVEHVEELGKRGPAAPEAPARWRSLPLRLLLYPKAMAVRAVQMSEGEATRRRSLVHPRTLGLVGLDMLLERPRVRAVVKRHVVPRFVRSDGGDRKAAARAKVAREQEPGERVRAEILRLARGDARIVVGPWLTEVGFELLYWVPFVAWAQAFGGLDPARLVVVSRGGTRAWYRHISPTYVDIFEHFTPAEFAARNAERIAGQLGTLKHSDVSAFDREIVERVRQGLGATEVETLHPALMYNLFNAYWREQSPAGLVEAFTSYRPLAAAEDGEVAGKLPERYVAVKFYTNVSFPDNEPNGTFVASMLRELCERTDVVVLGTGLRVDDHEDFGVRRQDRLHTIEHLVTPTNNLDVQTTVISRASAFVGTYGGFAYLAPFLGVDALSFHSHARRFLRRHLELAKRVFGELRRGALVTLDTSEVEVVRAILGREDARDGRRGASAGGRPV